MGGFLDDDGVEFFFGPQSDITISAFIQDEKKNIQLRFVYDGNLNSYPSYSKTAGYTYSSILSDFGGLNMCASDSNVNGIIHITHFSGDINQPGQPGDIISGTFDIQVTNGTQIVHLSNGRFDIKKQD